MGKPVVNLQRPPLHRCPIENKKVEQASGQKSRMEGTWGGSIANKKDSHESIIMM